MSVDSELPRSNSGRKWTSYVRETLEDRMEWRQNLPTESSGLISRQRSHGEPPGLMVLLTTSLLIVLRAQKRIVSCGRISVQGTEKELLDSFERSGEAESGTRIECKKRSRAEGVQGGREKGGGREGVERGSRPSWREGNVVVSTERGRARPLLGSAPASQWKRVRWRSLNCTLSISLWVASLCLAKVVKFRAVPTGNSQPTNQATNQPASQSARHLGSRRSRHRGGALSYSCLLFLLLESTADWIAVLR